MIRASDSGDLVLDTYASVTVTITSQPVPMFSSNKIQIFIAESIAIGSEITKVRSLLFSL